MMTNFKSKFSLIKDVRLSALFTLMVFSLTISFGFRAAGVAAEPTPLSADISVKLVTRCDLIKEYLSKTVRINELSARQNKVRGWEYILRRLSYLQDSYGKFSVDYSELSSTNNDLRRQLEQFKVDFEAYDKEFQKLVGTDCKADPAGFWRQLDNVRSFRAGISLSSDSYKNSLSSAIAKEEAKW